MATAASPAPEDRTNKRIKGGDEGSAAPMPVQPPPPRSSYPPPPQHYPGPHVPPPGGYYGGGPPPPYANHGPPPHHWAAGSPPPPPGRYPPPRGLSPDRGPPWPPQAPYREAPPPKTSSSKSNRGEKEDPYHAYSSSSHVPYPPPPGYGPPPPHWQGGPPPMYASQGTWTGKSPPRGGGRHHSSRGDLYAPRGHPSEMMMDHPYGMPMGPQSVDDDGASSEGESNKEKGRGSYKCGRCGVPKKGHVCPYQPKLKRRPDEPLPQTRNAAVQVEMDEFMTLRRLNIRIQGFPESYATEPYMTAEATTLAVGDPMPPHLGPLPPPPEMMAPLLHPPPPPVVALDPHHVPMNDAAVEETRETGVGDRSVHYDNDTDAEP